MAENPRFFFLIFLQLGLSLTVPGMCDGRDEKKKGDGGCCMRRKGNGGDLGAGIGGGNVRA
jgi:hypothetical protein